MPIKQYLEQTIKNLEAEREREIQEIRERVTKEEILPYNKEMDAARDKAIAELQANLNKDIQQKQATFEQQKKEIIDANERKKMTNAQSVISERTYAVTVKYNKAISKLNDQISSIPTD